ncbi:hypothetical protein CC80DRAFT_487252 [Byssothecium circinans]|uniref:Uncharacterized protein n=1 Tax=Byssothecium circinans TaxID=147558 RepID=A0A6A5UNX9_9PLEO|nr:hypothetical protein CC80DRAFT_487252 [Byssothecium circinans]
MSFLADALKILDDLNQKIGKHAEYIVHDTSKVFNSVKQDIAKNIDPSTLKALGGFGEEAGKHVGAVGDDIWKALLGGGQLIQEHAGPVVSDIGRGLDGAAKYVGKHIMSAVKDAEKIEWEKLPGDVKEWIEKHPEQTLGIIAGIVAVTVTVATVPAVLGALGFTGEGVAAGSIAAGIQSSIGDVAAGSLFATLMSAGQAGAGLGAVQGVVGGVAGVAAAAANAPGLIGIAGEEREKKEDEKKA